MRGFGLPGLSRIVLLFGKRGFRRLSHHRWRDGFLEAFALAAVRQWLTALPKREAR
jgi:hypothetical protein